MCPGVVLVFWSVKVLTVLEGGVRGVYYCCWWVLRRASKIAMGKIFWLLFKWLLVVYSV
jgi:hypothetical protein